MSVTIAPFSGERELSMDEGDQVTGGPGPLVIIAIVVGFAVGSAVVSAAVDPFLDGLSDGLAGRYNATQD